MKEIAAVIISIPVVTLGLLVIYGMLMDAIAPIVVENEQVQALGWDQHIALIEMMGFVIVPLMFVGCVAIWSVWRFVRRDARIAEQRR